MRLNDWGFWVMLAAAGSVACGATTSDPAETSEMSGSGNTGFDSGGTKGDDGTGSPSGMGGSGGPASGTGGTGGTGGFPIGSGGVAGQSIAPVAVPACDEGEAVDLAPRETAERLAQLFWRQAAPESLLEAAEDEGLNTTGAVACFAREMLEDTRADEGIGDFFAGWLDIGKPDEPQQDPEYVPELTPEIVEEAHVEAVRFALEIWRSQKGTLTELLLSSRASVSEELAPFYGTGSETGFIDLGDERAGVLSQLYFLITRTSKAHGSPTQRGSDMNQMLGCIGIPGAPLAETSVVPAEFEATTRQWYQETHVTDPACAGCHQVLDSPGFVFEHFDVMGRYRTMEAGMPIDATGRLPLPDIPNPEVTGHAEAMRALAESPTVRRCFASHFYGYALGSLSGERAYGASVSGEEHADFVEYLAARASVDDGFALTELFLAAVETEAFLAP